MASPELPAPVPAALGRRVRRLRLEGALMSTGNALLIGAIILGGAVTYVLGQNGQVRPDAWQIALMAGLPVLVLKMALDLTDRSGDAELWRSTLVEAFGKGMQADSELTRQARLAVELRTRLADAEARASRGARRAAAPVLARVDTWMDGMVQLARDIAAHRGEVTFQTGIASRARSRRQEMVKTAAGDALDAQRQRTIDGLSAQIASAEDYARFVEEGSLKLEHSVAALGAVTGQLTRFLAGGGWGDAPELLLTRIAAETDALDRQIRALALSPAPPALPSPEAAEA